MLGHRTKRFKLFNTTNLDALVLADYFYRQLEKRDLSFMRGAVSEGPVRGNSPRVD